MKAWETDLADAVADAARTINNRKAPRSRVRAERGAFANTYPPSSAIGMPPSANRLDP